LTNENNDKIVGEVKFLLLCEKEIKGTEKKLSTEIATLKIARAQVKIGRSREAE
jgi:hypothetical protein